MTMKRPKQQDLIKGGNIHHSRVGNGKEKMQNIEILERSARDWQPDYQPSIYAEKYCEPRWSGHGDCGH